jgi:cytochrome c-type biogenesis protein CcmF
MTVELGHYALILALMVALVQTIVPLRGAARGDGAAMALAPTAAIVQALLVAGSFGCLIFAHVTSDFSVLNVALNSHSTKPLIYKIAGTWGSHEGSMLLWVFILAIFGASVALFGGNLPAPLKARALAVQAAVACGFYLFILFTSNPFTRLLPPPADGEGLNPLLQDPGLAMHPPLLYLGYVGFSMAFSFAIAALIEGRVDSGWARWVRPWTLAAWTFLTAGIALGSWWAYYELGWGGWWYWDPVENASLMPWLAGTALLHSAIVVEKREALKGWTVFLAIVTFGLSLLGTFLVRSGVLTSVHAFATDPARGVFILALLVVIIGGSLALFAWRGPSLEGGGVFRPVSREGALLLNNLLLCTAAASVLLGTLYPLLMEAMGGDKISVGPPYFNAVFVPLMVPLVLALAVGPLLPWKRADLGGALARLWVAAVAAVAAVALALALFGQAAGIGLLGFGFAAWVFVGTLTELGERTRLLTLPLRQSLARARALPRAAWGMTAAHVGLAIAIAGMTGASIGKQEAIRTLAPGDAIAIAGYGIRFDGTAPRQGPNYQALQARFTVTWDGRTVATMTPERRNYPVEGRQTTESAIRSRPWGDLYIATGATAPDGRTVVRVYINPLVPWIWTGALIMVCGGLLSLGDRRVRVGAPARRATVVPPVLVGGAAEAGG